MRETLGLMPSPRLQPARQRFTLYCVYVSVLPLRIRVRCRVSSTVSSTFGALTQGRQ